LNLKHERGEDLRQYTSKIPPDLLNKACIIISQHSGRLPFKCRGIKITSELIKTTLELLNAEPVKSLPQNSRNDIMERTPDGLDKRIKEFLNTNLRTANIISDVLADAGIAEIVLIENPKTGRLIKGTKLCQKWCW
jgi:hypothetical protein